MPISLDHRQTYARVSQVLERIRDEFLATARVADAAWVSLDTV